MLKAQFAGAVLPAGSFWPSHPIRERILMLKSPSPDATRRIAGRAEVSSLAVVISVAAYATGQPPRHAPANDAAPPSNVVALAARDPHAPMYQLALHLKHGGQPLPRAPIVCMHPGGSASISEMESENGDAWGYDLKLRMEMADRDQAQVSVDGSVRMDGTSTPLHSGLRGPLGQPMSIRAGGHDTSSVELDIVPTLGCNARLAPPPPPVPPAPPVPPVAPPPPPPPVAPPPAPPVAPPPPPAVPTVEPSPATLKAAAVPKVPARPAVAAPFVMPAQSAVPAASAVPVAAPAPTVNPAPAAQPVPAPASSERR